MKLSDAEVFVMMTQDAVPADEYLVERLLEGLRGEKAAVAYARQLPGRDSSEAERYTRQFNYPAESRLKTKADLPELGIKTFFVPMCARHIKEIFLMNLAVL